MTETLERGTATLVEVALPRPKRGGLRIGIGRMVNPFLAMALMVGGAWYVSTHPQETTEARQYFQSLIDQLLVDRTPSKGEIFNPYARGGEITSQNTILLPVDEALNQAMQQSTEYGKLVIPLPFDPGSSNIRYEIGSSALKDPNYLKLNGVPKGTVFYAPASGELSWVQHSDGGMAIWIKELNLPWVRQDETKPFITFQGKEFSLLFPNGTFNTNNLPNGSIQSSVVHVEAGQPIFAVESEELKDVRGEKFQIGVSSTLTTIDRSKNSVDWFFLSLSLLAENGKAVSITQNSG